MNDKDSDDEILKRFNRNNGSNSPLQAKKKEYMNRKPMRFDHSPSKQSASDPYGLK